MRHVIPTSARSTGARAPRALRDGVARPDVARRRPVARSWRAPSPHTGHSLLRTIEPPPRARHRRRRLAAVCTTAKARPRSPRPRARRRGRPLVGRARHGRRARDAAAVLPPDGIARRPPCRRVRGEYGHTTSRRESREGVPRHGTAWGMQEKAPCRGMCLAGKSPVPEDVPCRKWPRAGGCVCNAIFRCVCAEPRGGVTNCRAM